MVHVSCVPPDKQFAQGVYAISLYTRPTAASVNASAQQSMNKSQSDTVTTTNVHNAVDTVTTTYGFLYSGVAFCDKYSQPQLQVPTSRSSSWR
jgi:hypothetical protein